MLEKIGQMAERAATSVSRRQFLGGIGRGAAAVAAAIAGLLALPGSTEAGPPQQSCGWDSVFECSGRLTGDACGNGAGTCRRIRGSTGCYCWIKGKK